MIKQSQRQGSDNLLMTNESPFTTEERVASMKGAIAGGAVAGITSFGLLLLRWGLSGHGTLPLSALFSGLGGQTLLINGAIAALSGALFALTYRYAIRQDDNPQLNAGVVLAFTLVRGLAQVDASSAIAQHYWPFLSACGESLAIFGSSAIALHIGFRQRWLARFGHRLQRIARDET